MGKDFLRSRSEGGVELDVVGWGHVSGYSQLGGVMVSLFVGGCGCGGRRICDKEADGSLGCHIIILVCGVKKGGRVGGNGHVSGWELMLLFGWRYQCGLGSVVMAVMWGSGRWVGWRGCSSSGGGVCGTYEGKIVARGEIHISHFL